MKNIVYIALVLFLISSCEQGKKEPERKGQSTEETLPLSSEYNWKDSSAGKIYGEVVYLPVYSSVYHQSGSTIELAATLSIHNTDINSDIMVTKINYYDSDGKLVQKFIKEAFELKPLQSRQFVITEKDLSGGTAAKFILQWQSYNRVTKPIVEAIMISTSNQLGISFKTESRVISSIGY